MMTTVSRKNLKLLGATDYLARRLTQALPKTGTIGRAFTYAAMDVLAAIDTYGQRPIRANTRTVLAGLKTALSQMVAGIETQADPLEALAADILASHGEFEVAIATSKQREAKFYKTHGQWIEANLAKKNNIVAFSMVR